MFTIIKHLYLEVVKENKLNEYENFTYYFICGNVTFNNSNRVV